MTYLELSSRKVKELIALRVSTLQLCDMLKGHKGYMNADERRRYLLAIQEYLSLADECENIMELFLSGKLSPFALVEIHDDEMFCCTNSLN